MDRIDHDQAEARAIVEKLHAKADDFYRMATEHLCAQEAIFEEARSIGFTMGPKLRNLTARMETEGVRRDMDFAIAKLLRDAAVLLDSYQAGHALATPHHLTGFALVPVAEHIDMPEAA